MKICCERKSFFIIFSYIITVFVFLLSLVIVFPLCKPFPYSDDWGYVDMLTNSLSANINTIFKLQNNHFIPLQKLLQFVMLIVSGGDFRSLILVNIITCLFISIIWINIFRYISKYQHSNGFSWLIPLIVMNWGFNTVSWGFNFQFISSFLFISLAFFIFLKDKFIHKAKYNYVFLMLILSAFCGGNGVVQSVVVGAGLIFYSYINNKNELKKNIFVILIWALIIIVLFFITREVSIASLTICQNIKAYLVFGNGLLNSWSGPFAINKCWLMTPLSILMIGTPLVLICKKIFYKTILSYNFYDIDLAMPSVLISLYSIFLIVIISIFRVGIQPWSPGLEMHYGFLFIGLPLGFLVSSLQISNNLLRISFSILLAIMVLASFFSNAFFRFNSLRESYKYNLAASCGLVSMESSNTIARKYIGEFYWLHGEDAINTISHGITKLRKTKIWSPIQ